MFKRNNLTIIESILVHGQGGRGDLQIGNRTSTSFHLPFILEIDEQIQFCSSSKNSHFSFRRNELILWFLKLDTNQYSLLEKIIILHNTGNMRIRINHISFSNSKCFRQSFSLSICTNIEIEFNQTYELKILYARVKKIFGLVSLILFR